MTNLYIDRIYNDILLEVRDNSVFVFLCASKDHIHDKVRDHLLTKNIQILYPEDLFMESINKDKNKSLLGNGNFLGK